ncbi:hypothetical protein PCANC_17950 [Puccinia coronata f. sp. avenae]|uniref:Uncharacterized protein n=2 Tax=Puccinia coronata f. sp. avenae TaxID=200324 RepID=A0A2N5URF3_9BASI|nr:hypothetical protein PCANC_17950 [Puccinia coronata f. sp. avenae]
MVGSCFSRKKLRKEDQPTIWWLMVVRNLLFIVASRATLCDPMHPSTFQASSAHGGNRDEQNACTGLENAYEGFTRTGNASAEPASLSENETMYYQRIMRETLEEMLSNPVYMQLAKTRSLNQSPDKSAAFRPRSSSSKDAVNYTAQLPWAADTLATPNEDLKLRMREELECNMRDPAFMRFAKAKAHDSTPASPPRPSYYPPNLAQANDAHHIIQANDAQHILLANDAHHILQANDDHRILVPHYEHRAYQYTHHNYVGAKPQDYPPCQSPIPGASSCKPAQYCYISAMQSHSNLRERARQLTEGIGEMTPNEF